jgi:hypothetical protein
MIIRRAIPLVDGLRTAHQLVSLVRGGESTIDHVNCTSRYSLRADHNPVDGADRLKPKMAMAG